MKLAEIGKYVEELTSAKPWLVDTSHHLDQILAIPKTLEMVAENRENIKALAAELSEGSVRTMGKGDKASNAEVIAAYGRLMGRNMEYTDLAGPSVKKADAFLACSYSGLTGDLLYRLKKIKDVSEGRLLGITCKHSPDEAPEGSLYEICDHVLHQPLPEEERTIVSSMSSFAIAFAGIAAIDVAAHGDDRVFGLLEVLSQRVDRQLCSQTFWNSSLELARFVSEKPSYWLATDLYLGAVLKTNINLREQSGLHVCQGLIDDFTHREIGLSHGDGANIVLVDTPDVLDEENFSRSMEMAEKAARNSESLKLERIRMRSSFLENVSDLYLKVLGAGYMASMLKERDPNASRNLIDKVRSY